ncbi:hypothetical protein B7R22_17830 [Subtercola boreus]|uniref:Uncharacterized protein n=1 Tax=Subtercola boreus TaxID=120213 RepID=A0A3E0VPZ9_9MICO|nr:DUF695 domain-containing protein [Subtercola boreus]RFA11791.1 hypothetical protein B7R22_17830 [Subtercola boreus]
MGLFKRRENPVPLSPIDEFWRWWTATGEGLFTAAIANGDYGSLPDQISAKVAAIDSELQWETSKGRLAKHALCVTAAGVAELRPLVERWARAAPPATDTWEFVAARQRDEALSSSAVQFEGTSIELGQSRVAFRVDEERQSFDVQIFNPRFVTLGLQDSRRVTFLLLDWLLGEDDVERWLGGIETVLNDPEGSVPVSALLKAVEKLAAQNAEPEWAITDSRTAAGNPSIVIALRPMKWIDHPLLDLHTEIVLPYLVDREDGLPGPDALVALRSYEYGLIEAIGARGLLVAFETSEGQRSFHVYTDSEDQNARDIIDSFRPGEPAGKTHSLDPGWQRVRQFS